MTETRDSARRAARQAGTGRSALQDASDTRLAIELIGLGARPQVVEAEVALSRNRVYRLYRELRGVSPPKGMLPFSADWFVAWRANAHASYLLPSYDFMVAVGGLAGIRAVLSSYRVYAEQVAASEERLLSFTRFWTLVRFREGGLLQLSDCPCCGGRYVTHAYAPSIESVCGLCEPPSRVRRGARAAGGAEAARQVSAAAPMCQAPESMGVSIAAPAWPLRCAAGSAPPGNRSSEETPSRNQWMTARGSPGSSPKFRRIYEGQCYESAGRAGGIVCRHRE